MCQNSILWKINLQIGLTFFINDKKSRINLAREVLIRLFGAYLLSSATIPDIRLLIIYLPLIL